MITSEDKQIGAIYAILSEIKTLKDGSCRISLEVNPDDIQVVNKLMTMYLMNDKLLYVAFVRGDE